MGDKTGIAWTDSTFNPWWGCTKISPGCDNCYAATFDHRLGQHYWDPKITPRMMSVQNWNRPLRWNREAEKAGKRHRVFCGSMCDVMDNKAPEGQRARLFELIKATPWLDWQLLTKRPQHFAKFLPADWGDGYPNVWLGVSVENQEQANLRIPLLLDTPARIRFLSCEPLLERVDLNKIQASDGFHASALHRQQDSNLYQFDHTVDWVIVGGESGAGSRPMHPLWALSIAMDCSGADVAFFFKQWGEYTYEPLRDNTKEPRAERGEQWLNEEGTHEFLGDHTSVVKATPVGKEAAGHLLAGKVIQQFPEEP